MTHEIAYSYDEEVDVLYVSFSPGEKATTGVEVNDNILLRFNRAEKRAIGLTLNDLEPDWQETVIDIITKAPVSQVLKVSVYSPSLSEAVPVALVERPPIPLAV